MIAAVVIILAIIAVIVFAVRFFTDKSPVSRVYDANGMAVDGRHEEAIAEYDRAIKDFKWAVRGHPDYMAGRSLFISDNLGYNHLGLAYAGKAESLCALGMLDEALEASELAMELWQEDARVRYARVGTLLACGLHEEALDLVALCIEHDPRAAEFYYAGVLVLLKDGRDGEAKRLADKAVSLCPDDEFAHASRAMVLWEAGDADGALDAINRAVSHSQGGQAKVLQRLRGEIAGNGRPEYGDLAAGGALPGSHGNGRRG